MNLTDTEMQRLDGLMQELRNSKLRVQAEAEWKREAINSFIDEVGKERMTKKQVNLLFKLYMLQEDNKLAEEIDSQENMVHLVEKLTNKQLF